MVPICNVCLGGHFMSGASGRLRECYMWMEKSELPASAVAFFRQ